MTICPASVELDPTRIHWVRSHKFGNRLMTAIEFRDRSRLAEDIAFLIRMPELHNNCAVGMHIANHLRVRFSVHDLDDIPADDLPEALAIIQNAAILTARLGDSASYTTINAHVRDVIGGRMPWIAALKRKARGLCFDKRPNWHQIAERLQQTPRKPH